MARISRDIRLTDDELSSACAEISIWHRKGRLPDDSVLSRIAARHFVPDAGDDDGRMLAQAEHFVLMTAAATLSAVLFDPDVPAALAERTFGTTGPSDDEPVSAPKI